MQKDILQSLIVIMVIAGVTHMFTHVIEVVEDDVTPMARIPRPKEVCIGRHVYYSIGQSLTPAYSINSTVIKCNATENG